MMDKAYENTIFMNFSLEPFNKAKTTQVGGEQRVKELYIVIRFGYF
jgi:hypothetical protein